MARHLRSRRVSRKKKTPKRSRRRMNRSSDPVVVDLRSLNIGDDALEVRRRALRLYLYQRLLTSFRALPISNDVEIMKQIKQFVEKCTNPLTLSQKQVHEFAEDLQSVLQKHTKGEPVDVYSAVVTGP